MESKVGTKGLTAWGCMRPGSARGQRVHEAREHMAVRMIQAAFGLAVRIIQGNVAVRIIQGNVIRQDSASTMNREDSTS